jgi:hypothetical protein
VSRWFVEEHDIRLRQKDDGEHDPHLPAAGEICAVFCEIALPEAETGENLLGLGGEGVAVLRIEPGYGGFVILQ